MAGCTGNNGVPESKDTPSAPAPVAGENTGSISGIVTDDALIPLSGVSVGAAPVAEKKFTYESKSDANGKFTFNDLAPGKWRVGAARIGYSDFTKAVDVTAGQVTEVRVMLVAVALVNETRSEVKIYQGRIVCGHGNPAFTEVVCGAALDPTEQTQKFLFEYEIEEEATGQLWEQSWKPTQILSRDLVIAIERDGCGATCPSSSTFGEEQGCCYLRIALDDRGMDVGDVKAGTDGAKVQSRTFPAFGTTDQPVNFFTDQAFTIYWEQFWGELPEDFETTRTNVPPT